MNKKSYLNGKIVISSKGGFTGLYVFGFVFLFHKNDSIFNKLFRSYLWKK